MAPRHMQPEQNPNIQTAYHPPNYRGDTHGVDMRGTSDTRGEVQTQVEQDVDQEIDGKPLWPRIFAEISREGTVQERVDQQMQDQAKALTQGVETRPAPMLQCSNYQQYEHQDLETMVKQGVDPGTVGRAGSIWLDAGNRMVQFQTDVVKAITNSEADWRGAAAESARKFMADVGNWVGKAGQSAQLAGTQTQQYSAALERAKNSMPPPVEFSVDAANADLQRTTNPLEYVVKYGTYMHKYNQQQEAKQEAVQVVGKYDSALGSASTMPAFAAPPTMTGGSTPPPPPPPEPPPPNPPPPGPGFPGPGGGPDGRLGGGPGGGPGGGGPGTGPGGIGGGSGSGSGSGGAGGGTPGAGIGTGTGTGVNPGRGPGSGTSGQGFIPGGGNRGNNSGNNQGGYDPSTGMTPGFMPPPGGGGNLDTTRGGGGGGRGFGGTGYGGGGGGAGGTGAGAGRGGLGPGGGSGAGIGGYAAEQAAGGRGGAAGMAGGRGAAGMGGMGGMGAGGRGEGGEDEEHQRPSYLVEPDPDSMFGTDEMTAPPVIGG